MPADFDDLRRQLEDLGTDARHVSLAGPAAARHRALQRARNQAVAAVVGAAAVVAGGFAFAQPTLSSAPDFADSPSDTAIPTAVATDSPSPQEGFPIEQMKIVRQVADAINARDADLLASSFIDDGTFSPYERWGTPPLAQVVPTWMENIEAWGLETQVRSCERRTESVVRCDVHTLWHTLQMEMGERWRFEFENGQLKSLVMVRSDLDPADRSLPLGYTDLDRWESWLKETSSAGAARRGVAGYNPEQAGTGAPLIVNFLRYDPTYSEAIGASIREYLDSR